jgi:hypothetical protein
MITVIQFDSKGRPTWRQVNTDRFVHKLEDFHKVEAFSEFEKAWFKRPLGK